MRIRVFLMASLGLAGAVVSAGCGSDHKGELRPVPAPAPMQPQQDASWSSRFVADCGTQAPETCAGAYGFTVSSEGTFIVGPGPAGQTFEGYLKTDEREKLDAIAHEGHPSKGLESEVERLAKIYYPSPFPNPCIDAAMSLKAEYDGVNHCERDTDCAYLGADFLPWVPSSGPRVVVDDCTFVPTLAVGNTFECVAGQLQLLMKRDLAKQVCQSVAPNARCVVTRSFDPGVEPPVCQRGKCRAGTHVVIQ